MFRPINYQHESDQSESWLAQVITDQSEFNTTCGCWDSWSWSQWPSHHCRRSVGGTQDLDHQCWGQEMGTRPRWCWDTSLLSPDQWTTDRSVMKNINNFFVLTPINMFHVSHSHSWLNSNIDYHWPWPKYFCRCVQSVGSNCWEYTVFGYIDVSYITRFCTLTRPCQCL